jgi:hypothetical protein
MEGARTEGLKGGAWARREGAAPDDDGESIDICVVFPCSLLRGIGGCGGGLKGHGEYGAAELAVVCIIGTTGLEGKGAVRDMDCKLW